ncbi:hypothetical protein OXPF_11850 [Oxobacter pfennigii]|uniref:VTT domain-containing protein n=1 Tax=Oxobacter pfennigii TaxID=36849 RepID=A0A0P8WRS4_9CLOT|nr:DedA family protein [Oxobacter pfennigii]KPU45292.1 hypothetical protein OXPF_11850 [Oxobacter pfennigii]
MEQALIDFTNNISANHPYLAYAFFFISAVLQIMFPPYPGDTVLIIEGYLSSKGFFNFFGITVNAIIATFLSCLFLYHTAYKMGDKIYDIPVIKRYFSKDKLLMLNSWFLKYGSFAILISKFIPGIGSFVMIAAGTFKASRISAYIAMAVAAILHNTMLVLLGRAAGNNMDLIKSMLHRYNVAVAVILIIAAGIYIYVKLSKKTKRQQGES